MKEVMNGSFGKLARKWWLMPVLGVVIGLAVGLPVGRDEQILNEG